MNLEMDVLIFKEIEVLENVYVFGYVCMNVSLKKMWLKWVMVERIVEFDSRNLLVL